MLIVANTLSVAVSWSTLMVDIPSDPLLYIDLRLALLTEVFAIFLSPSRHAGLMPCIWP